MRFTPDSSQKAVIEINSGSHLVLAPPGCGKTQILTERIRYAHSMGVNYENMLCLTFTNRAARGMKERIMQTLGGTLNADTASATGAYDNMEHGTPVVEAATSGAGHDDNDADVRGVDNIFVGNIHRFCARFLFENALIPAETSVIDDADSISIIARFLNEDETFVAVNNRRRREYFNAIQLSALMYQIKKEHPKSIRLHPESLSAEDVSTLKELCQLTRQPFTPQVLLNIYHHPDTYRTMLNERQVSVDMPSSPSVHATTDRHDAHNHDCENGIHSLDVSEGVVSSGIGSDIGFMRAVESLLKKMEAALFYTNYKRENHLVDFEDLLLLAYDALAEDIVIANGNGKDTDTHSDRATAEAKYQFRRYPWVQVDEVQDLNPMQLKIVDLLSTDALVDSHVIYLGDEQQAIFSFMGAKMSTLELLKERCRGNIHRLVKNHRSPKYLLQVFNHYAYHVLHIRKDMLPTSDYVPVRSGNELCIMSSNTLDQEYMDAAQQAMRLAGWKANEGRELSASNDNGSDETVAVIVSSNNDADIISSRMTDLGVKHFKVSGTDMFALPDMKLILAHLSVFANEHNFIAWARILKGFRVYEQNASARKFIREMMNCALLPTDLFAHGEGEVIMDSYVMRFEQACSDASKEIVVFDTETTGLSVTEDDIVQIAAVKMRGGEVVPNSDFKVFIHTDREIPQMLGDIKNPVIEEMKHNTLYPAKEVLRMFMDYVGDGVLLGHNADYDYNILDWNLRRYLPEVDLRRKCKVYFDSLKLAKLLEPALYQYKLKYLLEVLHLEGENSHLADADVAATCNVVKHCLERARNIIPLQKEFLGQKSVREKAAVLRRNYQPLYDMTRDAQYLTQTETDEPLIINMLRRVYERAREDNYVKEVKGYEYMLRYVAKELVDEKQEKTLHEQIADHILEITTLKESDLCSSDIVDENIFVTTVHKAKGLEFDNVIVFDVADDRYPGYFSKDNAQLKAEDARKLYVAMTRARKRLMIMVGAIKHDYHGMPIHRNISRFMTPVLKFFDSGIIEQ